MPLLSVLPPKVVPPLVGILGIAALAYVYGTRLHYPPIRSDGVGYYLYLPAAVIDRDLSLRTAIATRFDGERPDWAGVLTVPGSDRFLIKYPIGEALMLAPFFAVAHVLTLTSGLYPADGVSPLYQAAGALAGLVYVVLGLGLLGRMLAQHFSSRIAFWTLLAMVFGTNLFHYATVDSIFSHAFSFFLFVLFLHRVERWYAHPSRTSALLLAVVAGLITLVRPTNVLLFVFALLYGVTNAATGRERLRFLWKHRVPLGIAACGYGVMLMPQLAYWKYVTGQWVTYSYQSARFHFSNPEILNVLFSVRKGLFFWSPVLLIAVAGFAWIRRSVPAYFLPALLFLPVNLYVIATWTDWAYGGSFGHRAFVESIAVLAFGYAAAVQAAQNHPAARRGLAVATTAAVALTSWMMWMYWVHRIPYDGTTWQQFVAALPG